MLSHPHSRDYEQSRYIDEKQTKKKGEKELECIKVVQSPLKTCWTVNLLNLEKIFFCSFCFVFHQLFVLSFLIKMHLAVKHIEKGI